MGKVWRLNIKTASEEGIDPRKFCLTKKILGIGWPVEAKGGIDWEKYYKLGESKYYTQGDKGWWPAINAIKNRMKINDLCWTRDWNGVYYLGRITSEWKYEGTEENVAADVVNIRHCNWKRVGTADVVPGKVISSFIPARTVQAIDDETTLAFSQFLYNSLSGKFSYPIPNIKGDLFSLISAEDCEDIIGLYLQFQGYFIIPSSCRPDTAAYEFVMKHKDTGITAVAQTKNGYVDLHIEDYASIPNLVFLFTSKGEYKGKLAKNVHCIKKETIVSFVLNNLSIMPDRIKIWVCLLNKMKEK